MNKMKKTTALKIMGQRAALMREVLNPNGQYVIKKQRDRTKYLRKQKYATKFENKFENESI